MVCLSFITFTGIHCYHNVTAPETLHVQLIIILAVVFNINVQYVCKILWHICSKQELWSQKIGRF
jgi:hypothetical protein